jgi:(p)ppGpp synthase/HD superfamily hydrolase
MMANAQTNIQLYNQLLRAGSCEADLRLIHAGYQLAASIFTGHVRPNHKVFLAHLVGTASILAVHGADAETAAAGLLHSAYSHGEFGDGSRGIAKRKRDRVLSAVGPACEALIARYSSSDSDLSALATRFAEGERLSAADRTVAFIKLADVLEDHCDLGMGYSPNKRLPATAGSETTWCEMVTRLATGLAHATLASELRAVLDRAADIRIPEFLCGSRDGSYLIAPLSHRTRAAVRVARFRSRWESKLARAFARLGRTAQPQSNRMEPATGASADLDRCAAA